MIFDFTTIDVCIYHKDCCDGFTAAWLVHCFNRVHGNRDIKYIEATHSMDTVEVFNDIKDKNVLIVDFSYKRGVLESMKESAKSLLVIDHHKTAKKELEGLDYAVFDMNECGASLLYSFIFKEIKPPLLLDYVKDRDLWAKKLPHTRSINSIIQTTDKTFENWDNLDLLISNDFESCTKIGDAINRGTDFHALDTANNAKLVEMYVPENILVKMRVISVGVPGLISDTCNFVLDVFDDVDVVCSYTVFPDGGQLFSLRSRPSFDCSFIATAYGGGGHAQACGFKRKDAVGFPWRVIEDDEPKSSV